MNEFIPGNYLAGGKKMKRQKQQKNFYQPSIIGVYSKFQSNNSASLKCLLFAHIKPQFQSPFQLTESSKTSNLRANESKLMFYDQVSWSLYRLCVHLIPFTSSNQCKISLQGELIYSNRNLFIDRSTQTHIRWRIWRSSLIKK